VNIGFLGCFDAENLIIAIRKSNFTSLNAFFSDWYSQSPGRNISIKEMDISSKVYHVLSKEWVWKINPAMPEATAILLLVIFNTFLWFWLFNYSC